jgi:nitrite reductase/ring-hydroxylating ferredoxin subunit
VAEHVIGTLADFPPGSQTIVSIGKLNLGVFNVDGELYALPNICPHQFGPICTGPVTGAMQSDEAHDWDTFWTMEGRVLTCPWHGIEFDITTGVALATDRYKVRQYAIRVLGDEVLIRVG